MNLTQIASKTQRYTKKNASTILTCLGALGVVGTTLSAIKATPKAMKILVEQDIEKHVEPKTRGRKTLVKEIKPKQDAIQTQQLENNKEIKTVTDEKEQTI